MVLSPRKSPRRPASIRDRLREGHPRVAAPARGRSGPPCFMLLSSAMASNSPPSIFEARRQQAFPVLSAAELLRVRRFGQVQSFAPGESVTRVGEPGHGLTVVLSGHIAVTRQLQSGASEP